VPRKAEWFIWKKPKGNASIKITIGVAKIFLNLRKIKTDQRGGEMRNFEDKGCDKCPNLVLCKQEIEQDMYDLMSETDKKVLDNVKECRIKKFLLYIDRKNNWRVK